MFIRCNSKTPNQLFSTSIALLACMLLVTAGIAAAQTESVLYSFQGAPDGASPEAPLVADAEGNFYGSTYAGGTSNCGTVFKVTPAGVETVLYSFSCGADGAYPQFAGLVLDKGGNLYGTTSQGGSGYGVVYRLTSSGVETPLYAFTGGADGGYPQAGVVLDSAGNLYGTTSGAAVNGCGTVYKLTQSGTITLLHSFTGPDGCQPYGAGVVFGPKRTLYGATSYGGTNGGGTVYKVTLKGQQSVIYSFGPGDGPYAGVVHDKAGNIYGTTYGHGTGWGSVYEITPSGTESDLHSFAGGNGDSPDGCQPFGAGVVLDKLGNLFGAASFCGTSRSGVVYELSSSGVETVLHTFQGSPDDGQYPYAGIVLGKKHTLYGTTVSGGATNNGTVFKVTY